MNSQKTTYRIVVAGLMAALVFVVTTFIKIPLGESTTNFANGISLLAGLLFGGPLGGIAAGLGSAISDLFFGYDLLNIAITFVSKFLMAYLAGILYNGLKIPKKPLARSIFASVCGAVFYVILYMAKTYFMGILVKGLNFDGAVANMALKLPGSLINAAVAVVFAPTLCAALYPTLARMGIFKKIGR